MFILIYSSNNEFEYQDYWETQKTSLKVFQVTFFEFPEKTYTINLGYYFN